MSKPSTIYINAGKHPTFAPQEGITLHLLHSGSQYQVFLIEGEANKGYRAAPHDGQELRYVISGRVTFTVGQEEHTVEAGSTLRHASTLNHGFRIGDVPSTFITFALSRGYDVSALFKGTSDPVHN